MIITELGVKRKCGSHHKLSQADQQHFAKDHQISPVPSSVR